MRIGVDMLAVQSPGSRGRGVGRYGANLVRALLARDDGHEYILYAHDGLPADLIPDGEARLGRIAVDPALGDRQIRDAVNRLIAANPDRLDAFLTLSPFELCPGYDPPARAIGGPRMLTVVYDLIPFLYQETYLSDPRNADWHYRRLDTIRGHDALLAISDSTRGDCLRMMSLPGDRVVNVSGAGDGAFFKPDRSTPMPARALRTLHRLGVRKAYVFGLAGLDDRKNLRGLIDAFGRLEPSVRRDHQLVVTCYLGDAGLAEIRAHAESRGVADDLILTGQIVDDDLLVLYQRCAAFAFPSRYEGLGLPLLEAMHCGAAVVAGANSSQFEVVGDAGLLVNVTEPGEIAAALGRVLGDPTLAADLGRRAIARASTFTWERTAGRTVEAIERAVRRPGPIVARNPGRTPRPRLAMVSPFTPKGSGISEYTEKLVAAMGRRYRVDLYHEAGYVPEVGLSSVDLACYDHRLFARNARQLDYRGVVYQMGNSFYHKFLYDMLRRVPGVAVIHDFNLAGFQFWNAHQGADPRGAFLAEIGHAHPGVRCDYEAWSAERGGMQEACTRRQLWMNRRVFEAAEAVVVHSPWCAAQARGLGASLASKVVVIPQGAEAIAVPGRGRRETRERHGLPDGALIFGAFGILSQAKMNVEAIDAFRAVADRLPGSILIFVGQDWEQGQAIRHAATTGLGDRVRFLGRLPDADFNDLFSAVDVGVSLRRPPTYGETSAALLHMLGHALPTIVTDVATFADYPDEVVRKVRWDADGPASLADAFAELGASRPRREALGRAAHAHVDAHHGWDLAAEKYAEVVERAAGSRRHARAC